VSQEEVCVSLNIWQKLVNHERKGRYYSWHNLRVVSVAKTLRVDEFFKAVEGSSLADELVNFIIDQDLTRFHFPEIESASSYLLLRKNEAAF
jgi:hypothetical protein